MVENEETEFTTKQGGIVKAMPQCPYIHGVQCNQKENLCDKGKFEATCMMLALKMVENGIAENRENILNEGRLQACHVLLARGYIKKHYVHNEMASSSKMQDFVNKELLEAKEKGLAWHEIGWEFCRVPDKEMPKKDGDADA